jgi:hypothetical protein
VDKKGCLLGLFSSAPCASAGHNPTDEHNRCELKPGTPETSGKALFLVSLLQSLPLYVVYFGLLRLALRNPVSEAGSAFGRILATTRPWFVTRISPRREACRTNSPVRHARPSSTSSYQSIIYRFLPIGG